MQLTESHCFDAPIDAVWTMFRDAESHMAKYRHMGHREVELQEMSGNDDAFEVTITRKVDIEIPGFAKKVMQPTNTVTTTDAWTRVDEDRATGTQTVDTVGAPVKITATTELRADGTRTNYTIVIELDVKVPLVGGRIAKWASGTVKDQLREEFAAGDRWLIEHD